MPRSRALSGKQRAKHVELEEAAERPGRVQLSDRHGGGAAGRRGGEVPQDGTRHGPLGPVQLQWHGELRGVGGRSGLLSGGVAAAAEGGGGDGLGGGSSGGGGGGGDDDDGGGSIRLGGDGGGGGAHER